MRDYINYGEKKFNKAIFIDRDGTINVDNVMPFKKEDFQLFPDSLEALKLLSELEAYIFIITNQSGIALGKYGVEDMSEFNKLLIDQLNINNIRLNGIYYCPHYDYKNFPSSYSGCDCSKPKSGLLYEANIDFDFDLKESIVIGDKHTDIGAGLNAGINNTILVTTGIYINNNYLEEEYVSEYEPRYVVPNLLECAKLVTRFRLV